MLPRKKLSLNITRAPHFRTVASRDVANIDRELGLAKGSGGFHIADIESVSDPSTVVVVMVEKSRPHYARATMVVDVSKDNYPATKFDIGPIITPIKFIPEDDPGGLVTKRRSSH